jgi:ATP-dependent RNA helicase DeaD
MINRKIPGKKVAFGKIDIQNNETYVGVDAREAKKVVAAFEGAVDRGTELNVRLFEGGTKVSGPKGGSGGGFGGGKKKHYRPGNFKPKGAKPFKGKKAKW